MGLRKNKVYIVLGPTSSGKTSLTIDLCKKLNGEIISADSRQVVKYMDIGTGKLPINVTYPIERCDKKWIIDSVNVWGYDLTIPDKYFSGVDWAKFALTKAQRMIEKGKKVFLVGGTGFYIDLFTGKVRPALTKPNFELRKELESLTIKQLCYRLTTLDKRAVEKIDKNNPVRLIRAIEKKLSQNEKITPLPYLKDCTFNLIGLTAPRKVLYNKADVWAEEIWKNGLIEETRNLINMGFENSAKLQGLVYKSVLSYIGQKVTRQEAVQHTKYDLHAYIRRQQTYFKKNPEITWFDITADDFKEKIYTVVNG